jgi:hypothetical protein
VTISVLFGRRIQEFALQVQIELQKKLHDMVERTRQDLLEVHFLEFTLNVNMLSHFFRKWRIYWGVYIILLCDVFDFLVSKVVILQLTTITLSSRQVLTVHYCVMPYVLLYILMTRVINIGSLGHAFHHEIRNLIPDVFGACFVVPQIHRSILEKHVMGLHELEEWQNLNTDRSMVHLLPSPAEAAAAPPSALSAGASTGVCGEGNRTAAVVEDVQASEDGSLGNNAGA